MSLRRRCPGCPPADGFEQAQVDVAGAGGLLQAGDAFTQVIQRDRDAFRVEFAGDLEGVVDGRPATNRAESRRAREEVSIHPRNRLWWERKRKKLRTTVG